MLSDYEGASQAWGFAALLIPKNPTPFANLGYLYTVYLPDYPKAEANYRIAIANNPHDTNTINNFFELYKYHYKQGTSAAADVLKAGIAANPGALDLQVTLARYYRDNKQSAEAKTGYDTAIATAQTQGQTTLATQLQAEKAAL